ncbi:hypothetical protein AMAG_18687 [Allomyces macrogynus ATCC 38327]|uniref:LYC1 C-terminal domain-containing protein n=1 Tax=Allomyces macrogynus (strain ATCC 38327) TaxID=578462 RepID=A0A0L0SH05_ALLM3|nr:hypothetical protein AMAG_18687 [Allomyces macrogynus ATCC 38327]|eukprot:KNE61786.1 hypothetical protein AMAG_18687 [Allomyces macrogynus ATCC 38327]
MTNARTPLVLLGLVLLVLYYDRLGWRLFPSDSVSSADLASVTSTSANWIDDVTALDLLAESYAHLPQRAADGKPVVAVPLDAANYRWHHVRGVFYDLHTTAYAVAANVSDEIRRRAGASLDARNYVIWTHAKHAKSTLYILHLEATSPENGAELLLR